LSNEISIFIFFTTVISRARRYEDAISSSMMCIFIWLKVAIYSYCMHLDQCIHDISISHSSIPQTPILPNPHPPPTPPLAPRHRRPRDHQLANRGALAHLRIPIPYQANLNTANRRAKAAVPFTLLPPVIEDVRLRHRAKDVRCGKSVDDACARENAEV
jgi:hypothetical protein